MTRNDPKHGDASLTSLWVQRAAQQTAAKQKTQCKLDSSSSHKHTYTNTVKHAAQHAHTVPPYRAPAWSHLCGLTCLLWFCEAWAAESAPLLNPVHALTAPR